MMTIYDAIRASVQRAYAAENKGAALDDRTATRITREVLENSGLPLEHVLANPCARKARDGEPVFVLLGRDPDAGSAIRHWVMLRSLRTRNSDDKLSGAAADALGFDMYRKSVDVKLTPRQRRAVKAVRAGKVTKERIGSSGWYVRGHVDPTAVSTVIKLGLAEWVSVSAYTHRACLTSQGHKVYAAFGK